jgi:hypothetical protein
MRLQTMKPQTSVLSALLLEFSELYNMCLEPRRSERSIGLRLARCSR